MGVWAILCLGHVRDGHLGFTEDGVDFACWNHSSTVWIELGKHITVLVLHLMDYGFMDPREERLDESGEIMWVRAIYLTVYICVCISVCECTSLYIYIYIWKSINRQKLYLDCYRREFSVFLGEKVVRQHVRQGHALKLQKGERQQERQCIKSEWIDSKYWNIWI